MPVADSLVSRFQGGDQYGLIEKGFWSRDARKKNAAEAYAAAAAAQETADQTRSSNEAQLTKERDERLHGFDMSRMDESYKHQLANRMEELRGTGALAQGDMVKTQAELDAIGKEDRLKLQPEIVRNQLGTKLGQTLAERIRAQKFAERTAELTDAELDAQGAKLRSGKLIDEYKGANAGTQDRLTAAALLMRQQEAEREALLRAQTALEEARIRAGKGASDKVPIGQVETTKGSNIIDLNKLKGMGGSKPGPSTGSSFDQVSPETVKPIMDWLGKLF